MREFDLPSPGIGGMGHHLRRVSAKAVSYIQVNAPAFASGKHPNATDLRKFFSACADACIPYDATSGVENDASANPNK
jgi:hypothetical protein